MILSDENKQIALSQIKWQRYREGTYSGLDPLLKTKERLWNDEPLTDQDVTLLKKATLNSINHVRSYSYKFDEETNETYRSETLVPLYQFLALLRDGSESDA